MPVRVVRQTVTAHFRTLMSFFLYAIQTDSIQTMNILPGFIISNDIVPYPVHIPSFFPVSFRCIETSFGLCHRTYPFSVNVRIILNRNLRFKAQSFDRLIFQITGEVGIVCFFLSFIIFNLNKWIDLAGSRLTIKQVASVLIVRADRRRQEVCINQSIIGSFIRVIQRNIAVNPCFEFIRKTIFQPHISRNTFKTFIAYHTVILQVSQAE